MFDHSIASLMKVALPAPAVRWIQTKRFRTARPPVGWVRFGSLRRTSPISPVWGHERGVPINRRYIERFLAEHAGDVAGRVLEVADDRYTVRFGGPRVSSSDVLHAAPGNPRATLVGDLAAGDHLPGGAFDCIILTQVMQYVRRADAAVRTLHRLLAPGGVVLATLPGLERLSPQDDASWGEYWRFTERSTRVLFAEVFGEANVAARSYGNAFAAVASLMGLAEQDVTAPELDAIDPSFPVILAVRAVKAA
jgi:SAM-dependent methyltransferase